MITAVTTVAGTSRDAGELEREILTRIARAGLHICETELRYQLRSHGQPDLLGLLADLEQEGFIESETHYRLTAKGAARVPAGDRPGPRCGFLDGRTRRIRRARDGFGARDDRRRVPRPIG